MMSAARSTLTIFGRADVAAVVTAACLLGWPFEGLKAEVPAPERLTVFDAERTFRGDGSRGPYRVSDRAILRGSACVWVSDTLQVEDLDYWVDPGAGLLSFFRDLPRGTPIVVRFRQAPQVLRTVYRKRAPPDTVGQEAPRSRRPTPRRTAMRRTRASQMQEDGPHLDIGGTKSVHVAFASDRGPELSQSLRVHISGEVSEGVELLALLSDRNLPLQPDGRTRSLQELDRVTFQVRSRAATAGLGDLDVAFDETAFGRYRRQLQGASVTYSEGGADVQLFGAVSKGRWVTRRVVPVEGYQGPYPLPGQAGGTGGQVVAGSERVYLDGRRLIRGEGQDYTIDYERGLLAFTQAYPISVGSRITAEYQYLDDGPRRRLVGLRGRLALSEDRLQVGTTFLRETDHGSDLGGTGLAATGPPSVHHQVAGVDATYAGRGGLSLSGEFALSSANPGVAPLDDGGRDGGGSAVRIGFDLQPSPLTTRGRSLGQVSLKGSYRQVGDRFAGFDRIDRVENEGRWGWGARAERGGERFGELGFQYAPRRGVRLELGYGRRGGADVATRREAGLDVTVPGAPQVHYRQEEITRADGRLSRQRARIRGGLWKVRPGFRFDSEAATGGAAGQSALFYASDTAPTGPPDGIRVRELAWDVSSGGGEMWTWRSELALRRTRVLEGGWRDSLRAWSHRHRVSLMDWRNLSLSGEFSRSVVRFPDGGQRVRHTDLARVHLGYRPLKGVVSQEISYRISSAGAPTRKPVWVDVGVGNGTHLWEDVDGDGEQDPEEFVPDPDGNYEAFYGLDMGFRAVRDAALGLRFVVTPRRFFPSPSRAWQHLLSGLTVDLSLESDRYSLPGQSGAAPWHLYRFDRGPGVYRGRRDVRAVLHLFRYSRRASFRVSSRSRSLVDRTYGGGHVEDLSEVDVQGRFRIGGTLDLEARLTGAERGRDGDDPFAYGVQATSGTIRGLCRLGQGWRVGLRTGLGREREEVRSLTVVSLSLCPEVIRSLSGRGRIRGSLEWAGVSATDRFPLFLGMADGNLRGQNLDWRLGADIRVARYVTAYLTYNGRRRPERPVRHLGRMEMRASF